MDVFSASCKGRRANNDDFILSSQITPDCSLFLVADGMGGYQHGEIAASLACLSIQEYIIANYDSSDIKQVLSNSLISANDKINDRRRELMVKIGTTIAGALIEGSKAYIFWLGDVRIYHFRNNEIIFQSEDHSYINEMKKNGIVTNKEIKRYGSIVTKSISGTTLDDEPSIIELSLLIGDVLILCTDGFWHNFNSSSICYLPEKVIQILFNKSDAESEDNFSLLRITF